jgi:hypothetical protein
MVGPPLPPEPEPEPAEPPFPGATDEPPIPGGVPTAPGLAQAEPRRQQQATEEAASPGRPSLREGIVACCIILPM